MDKAFMEELKSLDQTVSTYDGLGALQLLPIGLFACLMAVITGGWVPVPAQWTPIVGVLGLIFAVAGYWLFAWSNCVRRGRTGESWPADQDELKKWAAAWAGVSAYVLVVIVDVPWLIYCAGNFVGMLVALWLLARWRRTKIIGAQSYSLTGLVVIGMLLGQPDSQTWLVDSPMVLALTGSVLIAIAITAELRMREAARSQKDD